MTILTLTDQPVAAHKADALVLATQPDGDGATLAPGHGLQRAAATHLKGALAAFGATGRVDDVHTVAMVPGVAARKVVLTGIAPKSGDGKPTADTLRLGTGAALRAAGTADTVIVDVPAGTEALLAAAAEGAYLGTYAFTAHKTTGTSAKGGRKTKSATGNVGAIRIQVADAKDRAAKATLKRAETLSAATAYARDLVNTPANILYPQTFADSVAARVAERKLPVEITVHDEKKLASLGCGGIVGVGQGSARPPRIVELHYTPKRPAGRIAFVGKGITFDTGGVCIKPAASMLTMKCDMAGAAAVAAAVMAAAEIGLPVAVSGYLCLAENMPGGNAQRPGDVVTMRSGTTVEIIDTDAEGRMVLADGISLAVESGADAVVDVATLTGACMVALGTRVAGVMANDEPLSRRVLASAARAGEPMWPLPLPEELRAKLDSSVADLQHKGDMYGGALTAGLFLREFAKDAEGTAIPWAHIDIAGPAFQTEAPFGHVGKGGTGYAVATLLDLAASWGAK
ncbi:leucyl aminopeptidase [Nostocoides australiense]|nr:leucyl aminopeptidase [Tetrasphaera australiensis]